MATLRDFWPDVLGSASRWGSHYGVAVAPELVGAIMLQENPQLDPARVTAEPGGRQSFGLMQVLGSTAVDLGYPDPRALLEPAVGIDAGTQYLAKQLARYGGDVDAAVAAYNAGSVRFDTQERYINQPYVDRVRGFFNSLVAAVKRSPFLPAAAPAVAAMAILLLWYLTRQRRAS
jgi:hypothetical protein